MKSFKFRYSEDGVTKYKTIELPDDAAILCGYYNGVEYYAGDTLTDSRGTWYAQLVLDWRHADSPYYNRNRPLNENQIKLWADAAIKRLEQETEHE